jgi:hypothetical protein
MVLQRPVELAGLIGFEKSACIFAGAKRVKTYGLE